MALPVKCSGHLLQQHRRMAPDFIVGRFDDGCEHGIPPFVVVAVLVPLLEFLLLFQRTQDVVHRRSLSLKGSYHAVR